MNINDYDTSFSEKKVLISWFFTTFMSILILSPWGWYNLRWLRIFCLAFKNAMMSASAFASPVKGIPPALPATLDLKLLKQLRIENVVTKEGARLCERFKVTDYAIGFTFKKGHIFDIKGNACPMGLPHIELCMFRISMFYNSVLEITNEKSFLILILRFRSYTTSAIWLISRSSSGSQP